MPVSIFGCGAGLYQQSHLDRFTLFGFKFLKYIAILLGIICISVGFVPFVIGKQLYDEDEKWIKTRMRLGQSESMLWDSPSGILVTQTIRNFIILQGVLIGVVCDIVATPVLLVLGVVVVGVGIPIMFYIEWSERQKIHINAKIRLRNILTRNTKLYHTVRNDKALF